jgi:ubiquinone/menaquinone biosynthesis C-methylase UbiE
MHSHSRQSALEPAPHTRGNVIHWAKWYDSLVKVMLLGQADALRAQTVAVAELTKGETVLEVGCGTGEVALRARKHVGAEGTVIGIDASPEMIQVARSKAAKAQANIDFRVGVIEALPYADNSVDVVLSSLMMHHLPPELKRKGLQEIRRVLKPRGRVVIVDLKRATRWWEKLTLAFVMHSALQHGVQDLMPILQAVGFTEIGVGDMTRGVGFVRAKKLDEG